MSDFTRGPWRVGTRPAARFGYVVADAPSGIDDAANVSGYGGHLVAESILRHNLHLIAAAPEMYEALFTIEEYFHTNEEVLSPEAEDLWGRVKATLAKAGGQ